MIEVNNLRKEYNTNNTILRALDDISITIRQGEIFGFIGLSGAGKTSLMRCISLLEVPTSGEILVDGVNLAKLKGKERRLARRKLGLVFQNFNLLMNKTVFENVAFPLVVAGKSKEYIADKTKELLELVGLLEKSDAYPSKLSGGQKQRVGIARALAGEPDIIICDEATSALDPSTTKTILELIKDINTKKNITFIIITHEMDVIKEICTKVAILEDGKIIESGDVVSVCCNPQTETARSFFNMVTTNLQNNVYQKALEESGLIIKATFTGEGTVEPHISRMLKHHEVEAAILSGQIQEINKTVVGCLVMKLTGKPDDISASIMYLRSKGIIVEEVDQNE